MYCKYCGYQLPDDAQFCPNCGKQNPHPNDSSHSQEITPSEATITPSVSEGELANESRNETKSQETKSQQTKSDQTKSNEIPSFSDIGQKKNGLFSKPIIVIAAVAIVVLLVAIIVSVALMSGGGEIDLYINSDPSGAKVYIGSEYYGETPVSVKLASDTPLTISIKKPGYDTWSKTINPSTSGDKIISATLVQTKQTSSTSKLYFTSSPSGAQVYINGKYCGDTPTTVDVYANTQCAVSIRKSGYEMWSQTIASSPSGTKTVNAKLTSAIPATPSSSKLYINSNPSGAQVYIGNVYYGTTPTTIYVSPDKRYTVYVEKSGYYTWSQTVTPSTYGSKTVTATLSPVRTVSSSAPSSSTLYITSTPSDANVYIDGYYRGETPLTVKVSPGARYTVSVEKPGYDTWSQTVPTSSSGTKIVNVKLTPEDDDDDEPVTPAISKLYVTSSPSGAAIYLDQDYCGSTPSTITVDANEEYFVSVEEPGYETWSQTVKSSPYGTKTISATLKPNKESEEIVTPEPVTPEPTVTPKPVTPEPTVTPEPVTPEPTVTPEPVTPEPTVTPEPVTPEPTVTPEPVTSKLTVTPEPVTPEPTVTPEPVTPKPTVTPEPVTPKPTTPQASKLHITSNPSGAKVYINDEYRGFAPITIDVSPSTEYLVSVMDSGYETWEKVIASYSSGTQTVNANLIPSE